MPSANSHPPLPPGKGFLGWLGRQIGHVSKAVQTDVEQPPLPASLPPKPLYREERVEEVPHPTEPAVTLRRTTIDEALPAASRED